MERALTQMKRLEANVAAMREREQQLAARVEEEQQQEQQLRRQIEDEQRKAAQVSSPPARASLSPSLLVCDPPHATRPGMCPCMYVPMHACVHARMYPCMRQAERGRARWQSERTGGCVGGADNGGT